MSNHNNQHNHSHSHNHGPFQSPPPTLGPVHPLPRQPHWTLPPPSPPVHTPTLSAFPISAVSDATLALGSLSMSQQPVPLTTPSPSVPQPSTVTVLSPPTPAPSPSPRGRRSFRDDETEDEDELRMWNGKGKGKSRIREDPDPQDLLRQFNALPPSQRFNFLSGLVGELKLNEALVVSRKIEPLLRRDFLRELPLELSLHCLGFVDEPKTLARAAQVSRYWNTLLQDEQTWKELFDRHHFPTPSSFTMPTARRRRSTAASGRSNDASASETTRTVKASRSATGSSGSSGSNRKLGCVNRITPFGLETTICNLPGSRNKVKEKESSFKSRFKKAYQTESNWLSGGRILANHVSADDTVVTTLCFDELHIVIGMANTNIHVFDAATGAFKLSLLGHRQGVWTMVLVSANPRGSDRSETEDDETGNAGSPRRYSATQAQFSGDPFHGRVSDSYRDNGQSRRSSFAGPSAERYPPLGSHQPHVSSSAPTGGYGFSQPARPSTAMGFTSLPAGMFGFGGVGGPAYGGGGEGSNNVGEGRPMRSSDPCGSARGWPGNKHNLVVSAGCDRDVKVWNVDTGQLIHTLSGHTSTVRCVKVLDRRPIAVSGSRDHTLRVWDIERGTLLHVLEGHEESVRCVEIAGNMAVSGSYDYTARVWDLDTGECVHVLRGHYHQIYSVAFDGVTVVTGSQDSTIRVWSAATGECLALLQGHTALVGQLQLSNSRLITGGSDGRVIIFDLSTLTTVYRLCAHDNSVTCLQFDDRFIVSGGNDGRVKLWELKTGRFVRELTRPCDAVWRVGFRGDRIVLLCQRNGKTCLEVVSFRPGEGERRLKG